MNTAEPFIDPTTGLFTLNAWLDYAQREARRCARYGGSMAIVVVGISTPLGAAAPATLNAVASAVSASLREHDVVGYLGDGQLAIALPETGPSGAQVVAERTAKLAASAIEKSGAGDAVATTELAMCEADDEGVARALTELGMLIGLSRMD